MIIDAHSHIEPLAEFQGGAGLYGRNTDLAGYLDQYRANGVDAAFVFMLNGLWLESRIPESNDGLARLRDQAPDFLYPWGTVMPAWPESKLRAEIRRIAGPLGLFGIKLHPLVQGVSLASPGMDILAEEAITQGLPVTFHDGSPEYCSAIQTVCFARKHPKLTVVSAHSGLREHWPDFIPAARELPNLWLCLSGPSQMGIQALYDTLGPEKLLFGSDGGLGHPAIITAYLRRIRALRAPEDHKAMILGGNAQRFLQASRRYRRAMSEKVNPDHIR